MTLQEIAREQVTQAEREALFAVQATGEAWLMRSIAEDNG